MNPSFHPSTPGNARCKCCGGQASLFGVVDFHKSCESWRKVLELSGIPIHYLRCAECGFIFTTAFDHFTMEDFQRHIYNSDYLLVDPEYQDERPRGNAALILKFFPFLKPQRLLDYGCGAGLLVEVLRSTGQLQVDGYDPFVSGRDVKPTHRYECIVCFEVLEHSTDPARTLGEINDLLTENGLILFSTLLQPPDIERQGVNWWYVLPRNGHVSLFSRASLLKLAQPFGFGLGSYDDNVHVLVRKVPEFAKHLLNIKR
jgi:SAM-dependent methyltransferase